MKCAIYLRKSVDRDREERSTSIESQRTAILEWAEKNGAMILPDWQVEDRGYSGSTEHRPGFDRLLTAARSGRAPFDCILVYDSSRFFRDHRKEQHFLYVFENEHKIRVVSITENDQPALLRNMNGVVNEEFRTKVIDRTVKAMHDIARRGLSCGGTAPYGYTLICAVCEEPLPCRCATRHEAGEDGERFGGSRRVRFAPNPETAPIVRRIFNAYANGGSYKDIARMLNAEGLDTPGHGTERWRGGSWAATSIRVILVNESYLGIRVYNQTKKLGRKKPSYRYVRRPAAEWIRVPNAHEAIITEELWRRVQDLRIRRASESRYSFRPAEAPRLFRQHLLSGSLLCNECGGRLTIEQSTSTPGGRKYHYYLCRRSREGACSNRASVRKDIAEAWVEAIIRESILAPEHVATYAQAVEDGIREVEAALGATGALKERKAKEAELRGRDRPDCPPPGVRV